MKNQEMLRTPASLHVLNSDSLSIAIGVSVLAAAFLVAIVSSWIAFRRMNIAEIWSNNLLKNGRSPNEILHAIGHMMFPMKLLIGGSFIALISVSTLLGESILDALAITGAGGSALLFLALSNREQQLVQKLRTIDPKKARTGYLTLRIFAGHATASMVGMLAAIALLTLRVQLLPFEVLREPILKIVEFGIYVVGVQLILAPAFIRIMLPSHRPSSESEKITEAMITNAFSALGMRQPQVRILALNNIKAYNALITGLNFAPNPLRQLVMISQDPELDLSPDETKAIIHHELAHSVLWHIPVRMVAAIVLWLLCLFLLLATDHLIPDPGLSALFITIAGPTLFFVIQPLVLGRLVREQEIQADEFAVYKLGSRQEDLISALSKLTIASGGLVDRHTAGHWLNANLAHPTVIEREAHLNRIEVGGPHRHKPDLRRIRAASTFFRTRVGQATSFSLATALILIAGLWITGPKDKNRMPAAETFEAIPKGRGVLLETLPDEPN